MTARLALVALVAMVGCKDGNGNGDSGDLTPNPVDTNPQSCGDNAPYIEGLNAFVEPAKASECEAVAQPVIQFDVQARDDDGDLTYWELRVWWDQTVDGVKASDAQMYSVHGSGGTGECTLFGSTLGLRLCAGNDPMPWNTTVELAATITDYEDNESPVFFQAYTLPPKP